MPFSTPENYVLEDEHVRLEPLSMHHLEPLSAFTATEPGLWQYSLVPPDSPEKMKAYFESTLLARNEGREYPFAVFCRQQQRFVGSTRFYEIDPVNRTTLLGYTWYSRTAHGTGLNNHCKWLLLNFAFDVMKVHRVEFRADARNARSLAAMRKIGCAQEGILRQHLILEDGSHRSSAVLSILAGEWKEDKRAALERLLR